MRDVNTENQKPVKRKLQPIFDEHFETYYRQAVVINYGEEIVLRSYSRKSVVIKNGQATILMCSTRGQERHVREFLKQHGFDTDGLSRHELLEKYGEIE